MSGTTADTDINFNLAGMAGQGIDSKNVRAAKRRARADAKEHKNAIDERVDAQVQPIYESAEEEKRAADEQARKAAIEARYAAKGKALAEEGIYQGASKEDRTPEMKLRHLRYVAPTRLGLPALFLAGILTGVAGQKFANEQDGISLPDFKLPEIGLNFSRSTQDQTPTTAQISQPRKTSGKDYAPDGRYFIQIKASEQYSKLFAEAKDGGHMICNKEDGTFGMIYKGLAFNTRDQAEPSLVKARLNNHTSAWVTRDLDCN